MSSESQYILEFNTTIADTIKKYINEIYEKEPNARKNNLRSILPSNRANASAAMNVNNNAPRNSMPKNNALNLDFLNAFDKLKF